MATGIEIVGLVLAVLPLIISALEHYEEGVSTIEKFFRYKREIRSIIEALATENTIFKNSCEQLLSDFLGPVELAEMLQNPRGETWSQPHIVTELRARLDRSYDIYMIHVSNMNSAIKTLITLLDLDENGKVRWTDLKGLKRLLKKGKLTLSRSAYQDLLLRMRECNRAIGTLTEQNRQLTPTRQSMSRYDHFRAIRDCAKEVYKALCASFPCSCVSHSINWQLDVPHQPMRAKFRVITATEWLNETSEGPKASKVYREIELRPAEEGRLEKEQEPSSMPMAEKKAKKVLRFADDPEHSKSGVVQFDFVQSSFSSTATLMQNSTSTLVSTKDLSISIRGPRLDVRIDDFCRRLSASSFECQTECLGYLSVANQRRYEVFPLETWQIHEGKSASLSLASLLTQARTASATKTLSLHDRLQLAKSVATGVLQLYNSPLLQSTWTKEDITFVPRMDKPYRKAYISKPTSMADDTTRKTKALPYIHNPTIFALGILLIEICLGRALGDLRTLEDCNSEAEMNKPSMATDYATAIRLLDSEKILVESGESYADAVRRCISCNFGPTKTDLENDDFRQAVYSGVVAPLEELVKAVLGASAL
ncbi:hypothetical protein CC80DRAFT_533456 [Byssothecium circinans]|uniref:DUF7580 domain-containing protein n=1 Tax=Byssothecium circinans TaxID=147558 RepID=A0A6A5U4L7_9PLEO|nr:hypothetical protein CC80DRAFT_533456 [Byssothecium circinans]